MTRNVEELNNLTKRAEDPKDFFGKMGLSAEQLEKRLDYTKEANAIFNLILIMLLSMGEHKDIEYLKSTLTERILSILSIYVEVDAYLIDYAIITAENFVNTTLEHSDDPWYTSEDRALFNAENGANDVMNYSEYKDAIAEGKTHKVWITEKDNKVRFTHKELSNKKIAIDKLFKVGKVQMRFSKDYEFAETAPEELVNCRCKVEYLPKTEKRNDT